jgi:ribose transport system substrate-binding protein
MNRYWELCRGRVVVFAALAIALTVGVAACGGSSSSSSSSTTSEASGEPAEEPTTEPAAEEAESSEGGGSSLSAFEEMAAKTTEEASATQTTKPPTTGPEGVPGKTVYVIPCYAAAEGCAGPANYALEAIKTLGWKGTMLDGGANPSKQAADVEQAIAAGADGIILEAIDAQIIQGPLQRAKAAGIPVVTFASVDQGHLFAQEIPTTEAFEEEGYALAAGMYGHSEHDLKLTMMTGTRAKVVGYRMKGTQKFVEECEAAGGECEINAEQNFAESAGLTGTTFAGSFDANASNVEHIREGGWQQFDSALAPEWIGYAEVDSLNRLFAGQEVVDEGVVPKLLTEENVPSEGTWNGDIDVAPLYEKVWGK